MKFTESELIALERDRIRGREVDCKCGRTVEVEGDSLYSFQQNDTLRRLIEHARQTGAVEPIPMFPPIWITEWRVHPAYRSLMGCVASGGRVATRILQRFDDSKPPTPARPNKKGN